MKVFDAFGKELHIGDTISWIGSPSLWKELKKGIILNIDDYEPSITARALDNPFGYDTKSYRNSKLITVERGNRRGDNYRFPRVVKL